MDTAKHGLRFSRMTVRRNGWSRPYRERANSLQLKKDRLAAGALWRSLSGSDNRTRTRTKTWRRPT